MKNRWERARAVYFGSRKKERAWSTCPVELRAASEAQGVPAWILDGMEGAESGWGTGGSNLFGLLAGAEGVDVSDPSAAAMQAAVILSREYHGSWDASIRIYSGGEYGIGHVEELQRGICP